MAMPVFKIEAETVAEAWEKAVVEVWRNGVRKLTQYVLPKNGTMVNQESKAATAVIVIKEPLKEPRVHAGDIMGQQAIINGYIEEVLDGTKDFFVKEGKWDYTYHERLVKYNVPSHGDFNQIESMIKELKKGQLFSRRIQAVTWQVWKDPESENPPCFQRCWVTVATLDSEPKPGSIYKINFQTCWRSRDLFDAWGANVNAMIELNRQKIIKPLNDEFRSKDILFEVGQYVDFSNDLHIYEKDFKEVENFLSTLDKKKSSGKTLDQIRQGSAFQTLINLGKSKRK
jgi:thymidylate synthase